MSKEHQVLVFILSVCAAAGWIWGCGLWWTNRSLKQHNNTQKQWERSLLTALNDIWHGEVLERFEWNRENDAWSFRTTPQKEKVTSVESELRCQCGALAVGVVGDGVSGVPMCQGCILELERSMV